MFILENNILPPGMPEYIASGSHKFKYTKYRFLILPRFKCDLHSIIKNRRVDQKSILVIAAQILDVLEHLHDKGYAHSDIKAENLMIGRCTYTKKLGKERTKCDESENEYEENENNTDDNDDDSGNEEGDEDDDIEDDEDDDEDKNSESESEDEVSKSSEIEDNHNASEEDRETDSESDIDINKKKLYFRTPTNNDTRTKRVANVEYSGSNPVRSCRMSRKNSTYQDMLMSHYLRPAKKVNYCLSDDDNDEKDDKRKDGDFCVKLGSAAKKAAAAAAAAVSANKYLNGNTKHTDCMENKTKTIQVTEDRIYLIDFGLAIKFIDSSGAHRPFCMDQRRAHDGTLEFTSRDAHMGAHSRRSDLECLGYNLIYWNQGSLPWKDDKLMSQPEQVHRMKEFFMTDLSEMYKHIYGKSVPKYIGDFMEYVGGLAYHDRPDYNLCRNFFRDELTRLGYTKDADIRLDLDELKRRPRKLEKEMENDIAKIKKVKSMMKLGMLIPFKENGTNRISPKNLRSKSEKIPKKQRKQFSWTEILSTDPDQIARQRAEKEYERDQSETPVQAKYKGKPTFAILQVENRMKFKEKLESRDIDGGEKSDASNSSSTKDTSKLRKTNLTNGSPLSQILETKRSKKSVVSSDANSAISKLKISDDTIKSLPQRKAGLRKQLRPTEKSLFYRDNMAKRKQRSAPTSEFSHSDESSCSSNTSREDNGVVSSSQRNTSSRRYNSSCGMSSPASDEDSRDTTDYSPIKTRCRRKTTSHYRKGKSSNARGTFKFIS